MTRSYKDFTIRVEKYEGILGVYYRAEWFIPKNNGLKANMGVYETFDTHLTHTQVLERVHKIIENVEGL